MFFKINKLPFVTCKRGLFDVVKDGVLCKGKDVNVDLISSYNTINGRIDDIDIDTLIDASKYLMVGIIYNYARYVDICKLLTKYFPYEDMEWVRTHNVDFGCSNIDVESVFSKLHNVIDSLGDRDVDEFVVIELRDLLNDVERIYEEYESKTTKQKVLREVEIVLFRVVSVIGDIGK